MSSDTKKSLTQERSYRMAFVLAEESLRRIVGEIEKALGESCELSFDVRYIPSIGSMETGDIDEVLADANDGTFRVHRLTVTGNHADDWKKRIKVSFAEFSDDVSLDVSGNDRSWLFATTSVLDEEIRKLRLAYSVFPPRDPFGFSFLGAILLSVAILLAAVLPFRGRIDADSVLMSVLILWIPLAFLLSSVGGKMIKWLLPRHNFAWGGGLKRFTDSESRRRAALWSVAIPTLIGLIFWVLR